MESAAAEARLIVRSVAPDALAGKDLDAGVVERARELARRRVAGEPLQYLTGGAGFRHLELEVGPGVLIPRPETELVVEKALELVPHNGVVVDVGTGSGAIALSLAQERPDLRVVATDISEEALEWARRNACRLNSSVRFLRGDLLEPLPDDLRGRIHVIVSNPPYVATGDVRALPRDVADHEPRVALFAGHSGLEVVERLASDAAVWLRPEGHLVLEIGETQGDAVRGLLERLGYGEVEVARDLNGRDRIAWGAAPGG